MSGFYAGIGSRETPDEILEEMFFIAAWLSDQGWKLRTGCAPGADQAFARGAGERGAEWFLPWSSFESSFVQPWQDSARDEFWDLSIFSTPAAWTYEIAAKFHPAWDRLSEPVRKLHARNVHQILGPKPLSLSESSRFVICWTPGGSGSGGTGQAIRIARAYKVPVFDMGNPDVRLRVVKGLAARV